MLFRPFVVSPATLMVVVAGLALMRGMGTGLHPTLGLPSLGSERGDLEVVIRDADWDVAIPARVRIHGEGSTPDPDGSVTVTAAGRVTVTLAAGRYRVSVSRGPEWTLFATTIDIEPGLTTIEARLRHVIDPGDFVACDFHVHAAPSRDSEVGLEERVASLAAEGVRFAVATDHNHVTDYAPAARALGLHDFGTAPGVEVTTWAPSFGHFNAWPLARDPNAARGGAPSFRDTTPSALFASLHALGPDVLVQVNHPRLDDGIGYFDAIHLDAASGRADRGASLDFDAIEVWNGYELGEPAALDENLVDWMALLRAGHRVSATGNSDSHDVAFHTAGYPRTYVEVAGGAVDDPNAVARALREGRAYVTSGPLLDVRLDGKGPGETVQSEGVADLDVRVRAPRWVDADRIEVWMNGALVASSALEETGRSDETRTLRFRAPLEVHEDGFVIILVRGERPLHALFDDQDVYPIAFTNPIWIERTDTPR